MTNNRKRYTNEEKKFIDEIAELVSTRKEMEEISPIMAEEMQRTIGGIQKQIEVRKDWFYR